MTAAFIFLGAALVLAIGAAALSARYRRFDQVTTFTNESVVPHREVTLLATDEEVTREALASSGRYDADDDLLDPRNANHAQWLAEHAQDSGAAEDSADDEGKRG